MASSANDQDDLREVFDHAACGLLVLEVTGTIRQVNHTFAAWLGFAPEELVAKKRFQDLLTIGCRIFHQTHWLPLLQIQGSVAEVQLELTQRDRGVLPVLVNALRRETRGVVHHHVAAFVTADRRKYERELLGARKRAEQLLESERSAQLALADAEARLRLALDSAHLLVWRVDPVNHAPNYEQGVRALLALPDDDTPLTADAYRACIHADDREKERAALAAALDPCGTGRYAIEYRLRGHDGREHVVSSSGRAFFDDAGRLARFAGVLQDVTSWRRAERALREQEQEAQARAVLAEQLVGIVSHDLRTPLNAVLLGASLLAASDVTPAQARTVHRISAAANRATRLIADFLDFTQARLGGGLPLACKQCDLHDVVKDTVDELRLAWPERTIEHHAAGAGDGWLDPDRLAQVVINLANNALTYGAPERPVSVTTRRDGSGLVLEVANEGAPVPAALLPHIFEPLRRGEQKLKRGSRSVGLGLYIVRQIAVAHGGEVSVRSSAAEGTCFAVRIPLPDA